MSKIENLINLLGQENEKRLKKEVTDFIIDTFKNDLSEYSEENYILDVSRITEFLNMCEEEAFERVKEDVIEKITNKIKINISNL